MVKHSLTAQKRWGIFSSFLFWAFMVVLCPSSLVVLEITGLQCSGPARCPEALPRAVCMRGTRLGVVRTGAVAVSPWKFNRKINRP